MRCGQVVGLVVVLVAVLATIVAAAWLSTRRYRENTKHTCRAIRKWLGKPGIAVLLSPSKTVGTMPGFCWDATDELGPYVTYGFTYVNAAAPDGNGGHRIDLDAPLARNWHAVQSPAVVVYDPDQDRWFFGIFGDYKLPVHHYSTSNTTSVRFFGQVDAGPLARMYR